MILGDEAGSHKRCSKIPPRVFHGRLKTEWKTFEDAIVLFIMLSYNNYATQIQYFRATSVHFYFGKNACPFRIPVEGVEVCVAANGAMRFSVRSFGYALFNLQKEG